MHALIGQIGEGVAKRAQLPIKQREDLGAVFRVDHIVDAVIAMHNCAGPVIVGHIGG